MNTSSGPVFRFVSTIEDTGFNVSGAQNTEWNLNIAQLIWDAAALGLTAVPLLDAIGILTALSIASFSMASVNVVADLLHSVSTTNKSPLITQNGLYEDYQPIGGNFTGGGTTAVAPYPNWQDISSQGTVFEVDIPYYDFANTYVFSLKGQYGIGIGSTTAKWVDDYINISAVPAVEITGAVTTTSGQPAANATIYLDDGGTTYAVRSNQYGQYRFFAEPGQTYEVWGNYPTPTGNPVNSTYSNVTAPSFSSTYYGQTPKTINMVIPSTILNGTVEDHGGNAIENATVTLSNANGLVMETTTDSQGNYSFGLSFNGTYDVSVQASGYDTVAQSAVISTLHPAYLNFKDMIGIVNTLPLYILSYYQILVTNTQDTATPNPYDQMIAIDSNAFHDLEAQNLSNVEFFYTNGTLIPSWLESGNSFVFNKTVYWLKLYGLAPLSSEAICIGFASTSANLFYHEGGIVGEAPQYSVLGNQGYYGEYDDGWAVFPIYFNGNGMGTFSVKGGLSLEPVLDYNYNGMSINALHLSGKTGTRSAGFVFTENCVSGGSYIQEYNFQNLGSNAEGGDLMNHINASNVTDAIGSAAANNSIYLENEYVTSNSWQTSNPNGTYSGQWVYGSNLYIGGSSSFYSYIAPSLYSTTGGYYGTVTSNPLNGAGNVYIGSYFADHDNVQANIYYNWMRVRAYPPNGVMPTASKPIPVKDWVSVYINNTQGNPTPNPFQQLIQFDATSYAYFESTSLGNVEFQQTNGAVLPSWLESGTSSSLASFWVKVPSIPAYSSMRILMVFVNKTESLMNGVTIGEAPQLTSIYGQFDDGPNVFAAYWNFEGTTLPSGLTTVGTGIKYSVNDSLTVTTTTTSTGGGIISTGEYSYPLTLYSDILSYSSNGGAPLGSIEESTSSTFVSALVENGYAAGIYGNGAGDSALFSIATGSTNKLVTVATPAYPFIMSLAWMNTGSETAAFGSSMISSTDSTNTISAYYLSIDAAAGIYIPNMKVQWLFAASTPPNGIMPSVSMPAGGSATITFAASGNNNNEWSVSLSGPIGSETQSTTGTSLEFVELSGYTYSYTANSSGYSISNSSESIDLGTSGVTENLQFTPAAYYTVTFTENGLPSGANWSVTLSSTHKSATAPSSIVFSGIPNGEYSWGAGLAAYGSTLYEPDVSGGTVSVAGSDAGVGIGYHQMASVNGTTMILLANGTYEMARNITVGTQIMTFNTTNVSLVPGTVLQVFEDTHTSMISINGYLNVSADQLIWTNHGYVTAQNLTVGDKILDVHTGTYTRVNSISIEYGQFTMYGFEVSVNPNYVAWEFIMYEV